MSTCHNGYLWLVALPLRFLCVIEHPPTAAISFRILELYGGLTFSQAQKPIPTRLAWLECWANTQTFK